MTSLCSIHLLSYHVRKLFRRAARKISDKSRDRRDNASCWVAPTDDGGIEATVRFGRKVRPDVSYGPYSAGQVPLSRR